MYSAPPSARSEGQLSSRSYMSNADDLSTLHSYRAHQRAQKVDAMTSSTHTIQQELPKLVKELGDAMNQHPTIRDLIRATAASADGTVGTSKYISSPVLMGHQSVLDFIRVENYLNSKAADLKHSQSVYSEEMARLSAAKATLESLASQLGVLNEVPTKNTLSKLALAQERHRHLSERLSFLKNQVPAAAAEDIATDEAHSSSASLASPHSPSEVAHTKRLEGEKLKLQLLTSRHSRLAATKQLMGEEQTVRAAIVRAWASYDAIEAYAHLCIHGEEGDESGPQSPAEDTLRPQASEDSPIVPSATSPQSTQLQSPIKTFNTPKSALASFRQRIDDLAGEEVKRLHAVYNAKKHELEELEGRVGHLSLLGSSGPRGSLESLQAKVKNQEAEIEALQDQVMALEGDLAPGGDYVDLEAMLIELRPQEPGSAPPLGHEASSTLGKMAHWAASYGSQLIDCAKEIAAAECDALKTAELLADLEVKRSDFVIKAQYKGHHSVEQRQIDALDTLRGLEAALLAADRESAALRSGIEELELQASQRQNATHAIDVKRSEYFGAEAQLEGEKRDLQKELDQLTFVLESIRRAASSFDQ